MIRTLSFAACAVLVVAAAVVHAAATHRWSVVTPDPARAQAAHAHAIQFADYRPTDIPSEMPVKERSAVTCRRYDSAGGAPAVVVSLTSGPPGAVSTHTPDVCYPGGGYKIVREPKKETIDLPGGKQATYLVAEFEKKTATAVERQRVRWAWSADGGWGVPDRPRLAFLRDSELFKLYVVTGVSADAAQQTGGDSPEVKSFVAAAFAQYAGLLAGQ